jgi:endo-1,4-beta-mannosidase
LKTVPTFIVGHMSGQNYDIPWRNGRDLYTDKDILKDQDFFVKEMAKRFKDHPAIAGWLLSNEVPFFGGFTTQDAAKTWMERLIRDVRSTGDTHPISTGDGGWGMEVTGSEPGFHLRDIDKAADYIGVHAYPDENDKVRQLNNVAFRTEMSHFNIPVLTEEFGASTAFASEKNVGVYYRQVLYSTLLAGSSGWVAWNNTDFDLPAQDPYFHHGFEEKFGITNVDGSPKAPLIEMQKFRKVLDQIDVANTQRPRTDVAVLVPNAIEMPRVSQQERGSLSSVLAQDFVATKEADLGAAFVREADPLPDVKLLIVPSTKVIELPTWKALEKKAEDGATVFVSYFAGEGGSQRGLWIDDYKMFGVEQNMFPGMVEPINDKKVTFKFEKDFGGIKSGSKLTFSPAGNVNSKSFVPVTPLEGTKVIARDQHGHPALVERKVGKGRIVFSTYPVDSFAAKSDAVNPESSYDLYKALAQRAGVELPVTVDSPSVMVDRLVHKDGRTFAFFASASDKKTKFTAKVAKGFELRSLDSGERVSKKMKLEPYDVVVLELRPVKAD